MALISTGLGVDYDHAPVPVAIGHENFVAVNHYACGTPHVFGIVAAAAFGVMPDLQDEFPALGELENLCVFIAVAAYPHVVFRIDEYAVFVVGPLVALRSTRLSGTTPGLHHIPGLIELNHRGRGNAAVAFAGLAVAIMLFHSAGTMQDPYVIVRIHRRAGDLPQHPVIRERLRPEGIRFELRDLSGR